LISPNHPVHPVHPRRKVMGEKSSKKISANDAEKMVDAAELSEVESEGSRPSLMENIDD
jgi:hypothetical protein